MRLCSQRAGHRALRQNPNPQQGLQLRCPVGRSAAASRTRMRLVRGKHSIWLSLTEAYELCACLETEVFRLSSAALCPSAAALQPVADGEDAFRTVPISDQVYTPVDIHSDKAEYSHEPAHSHVHPAHS